MNRTEVGQLLALAALVDNRTVTPEACLMWHELTGAIPYQDAVEAMHAHYRESTDWLMPAHVVRRVTSMRKALEPRTMSPAIPASCATEAEHRWLPDGTCVLCESRLDTSRRDS